jgi:hypothetical protein
MPRLYRRACALHKPVINISPVTGRQHLRQPQLVSSAAATSVQAAATGCGSQVFLLPDQQLHAGRVKESLANPTVS